MHVPKKSHKTKLHLFLLYIGIYSLQDTAYSMISLLEFPTNTWVLTYSKIGYEIRVYDDYLLDNYM